MILKPNHCPVQLMHTFVFNSISVVVQWQVYQLISSSNKVSK